MRMIYSRAEVGKIAEYREILNYALVKFEVRHANQVKLNVSSNILTSFNLAY